jgi:hypothetical protein
MKNLNEQRERMLKLINFSLDDHTHDNLSEKFIIEEQIKKTRSGDLKIKRGKQRFIGKSGDSDEVDYEDGKYGENNWDSGEKMNHRKQGFINSFKKDGSNVVASQKMMTHMSDVSKKNWQKLINDPKNVEYAIEAVDVYRDDYSKLKGIQAKKLVIIVGNDEQTEFEIIEPEEQEIPDIVVPIQLPVNEDPSNLFENCKYSPNGNFVAEVDELVSIITKQKEQMKDPRVFCSYIDIESSASRYRNVCGSDKTLSWTKLSKLRNDAALKYLKERLISAGVMVDNDTKIAQDYSGKNGDGSSGPNPPKGLRFNTDGTAAWSCGDSSAEGQKCKGKRNDFGAPSSNESDYDEYRYVIMDLGLIFKGQATPDPNNEKPEPEVKEIKTELYDITFYVPPVGLSFWLPKITMKFPKFRWIKRRRKKSKKRKPFKTTGCPKW